MHETVTRLADEVKALRMVTESLSSFTSWPDDLTACNSAPNHAPAAKKEASFMALTRIIWPITTCRNAPLVASS